MTLHWKLVIDANDPHAQAAFWAETLGYEVEVNSALIDRLLAYGAITEEDTVEFRGHKSFRDLIAVRHPDDPYEEESGTGLGRRILFQRVPETKVVKNRLHLDVHAESGTRETEVERLKALGATVEGVVKEQGGEWTVMLDPEQNEFCVH